MYRLHSQSGQTKLTLLGRRQIEGREWWLWGLAVTVTLLLTAAVVVLAFFSEPAWAHPQYWKDLQEWVRGLSALVLLFDIYTMYQHLQLQRVRRQLAQRDELFELITHNAADMIAVVDKTGRRLYNSPAYQKVLGYSAQELCSTSAFEQIHPADQKRVQEASEAARRTGQGQRIEYRMRHKNGSWRVLESTASPIRNERGETDRLVIVNRDITDRKLAEDALSHNALHDALTDLPNRNLFLDRLQHSLLRARRHSDYEFAVLFVDVDDFKVVNDSLGHSAGDKVLVEIARRLTACFRESDTIARPAASGLPDLRSPVSIARLGGDEFTVLLEDTNKPCDVIKVAQRIQEKLALPFEVKGRPIVITASIGVAVSSRFYSEPGELLRDAEIAMYRAKQAGKARSEVFDPTMHTIAVRRLQLESDLRRGIERGELVPYFQPIISLSRNTIVGFEALSRWLRPGQVVPPSDFIPVAEETGLIVPINRALLLESCQQLRTWQAEMKCAPPLTISVNVTARQCLLPDLAKEIGAIIEESKVPTEVVNLEITETVVMEDPDFWVALLSDLKALGTRISIDDFGTGHSSLSRLQRLPIDYVKIDRLFISRMTADHESREIVRFIIMLAHSVGAKVIAEGTETEAQLEELERLGCEMVQGFYYSPPVEAKKAFELLLESCKGSLR
jgi:PAS domain S-box-containing protein